MRASESTLVLSGELWRRRYRCACNHDPLSLTDAQLVTCAYLVAGLFCNADRLANASELPDAFGNSVLARQRFCRLREALAPFGVDVLNNHQGSYRLPLSRRNVTLDDSLWQAPALQAMPERAAALKQAYDRYRLR